MTTGRPRRAAAAGARTRLGAWVLPSALLVIIVVPLLLGIGVLSAASETTRQFRAEATRTLVPGADRATVERFFDRHSVSYAYKPDTVISTRFGDQHLQHHGAAYQGWWTPPNGFALHLIVLIDAHGRVLAHTALGRFL